MECRKKCPFFPPLTSFLRGPKARTSASEAAVAHARAQKCDAFVNGLTPPGPATHALFAVILEKHGVNDLAISCISRRIYEGERPGAGMILELGG